MPMVEAISLYGIILIVAGIRDTDVYNPARDELSSVDDIFIDAVSGSATVAVRLLGGFLDMSGAIRCDGPP
jgi:hypothetical protein